MDNINLKARAKINLTLDVVGKRPNGYHDLIMIMQTVALYDGVYIKKIAKEGIRLKSNLDWLPTDDRNLAYRAAKLLMNEYNIRSGVYIELDKRIPVAAGLAGGSADCAAVLVGINKLFGLKLPHKKLMEYGLRLGADVPYCIMRGTVLAEGIGEELTKLTDCPDCYIVLAKPSISVSTAHVFQSLAFEKIGYHPNTKAALKNIQEQNVHGIGKCLCNVLENVVIPMHPEVGKIKRKFLELGAVGALMSGSGPTVYGIFEQKEAANYAAGCIKDYFKIKEVYMTTIFSNKKMKGEMNNDGIQIQY